MDYKKMYEELQKENELLKNQLKISKDENQKYSKEEKEWRSAFYEERQEKKQLKQENTSLKKALEYTKKNKVNEDDDPFLPESQDVGGLDTE